MSDVKLPDQLVALDDEFQRIQLKRSKAAEHGATAEQLAKADEQIARLREGIAKAYLDEIELEAKNALDKARHPGGEGCRIEVLLLGVTFKDLVPDEWILNALVEGGLYSGPVFIHVSSRNKGNGAVVGLGQLVFAGKRGTCPGNVLIDFVCQARRSVGKHGIPFDPLVGELARLRKTYACPGEYPEDIDLVVETAGGKSTFTFTFRIILKCDHDSPPATPPAGEPD